MRNTSEAIEMAESLLKLCGNEERIETELSRAVIDLRTQLASALEAQQKAERERDELGRNLGESIKNGHDAQIRLIAERDEARLELAVQIRHRQQAENNVETATYLVREARAEVQRLKSVCFEAYQFAGCLGAPERVLDNLSDAVHGNKPRHETILPVSPDECAEVQRLREWMKAANQFAWAHERTCPRHDADEPCNCGLDQFLSGPRPFVESYKTEVQRLTQAAKYEADVAMQAVAEVHRLSGQVEEMRHRIRKARQILSTAPYNPEAIDAAMGAPGEGQSQ